MSDIIDSIKQGAGQLLSSIDQQGHIRSAIQGIKTQFSEVERRRRLTQVENEKKALQAEMKQLTEALGLQALSLYEAGTLTHPELSRLCERIGELRGEIESKTAELEELRAQAKETQAAPAPVAQGVRLLCPRCGSELAESDAFCRGCGAKLKMPEAGVSAGPFCASCGARLRAQAKFCPACGHAVQPGP